MCVNVNSKVSRLVLFVINYNIVHVYIVVHPHISVIRNNNFCFALELDFSLLPTYIKTDKSPILLPGHILPDATSSSLIIWHSLPQAFTRFPNSSLNKISFRDLSNRLLRD